MALSAIVEALASLPAVHNRWGGSRLDPYYRALLGQWRRVVQVFGVERRKKPPLSFMSIDEYCAKFQAEQQHMSEQQS
jgi:hypothetical protein